MKKGNYTAAECARAGKPLGELIQAGYDKTTCVQCAEYTCTDFRENEIPIKTINKSRQRFTKITEWKKAGSTITELLQGGYNLQEIKDAGYPADDFEAIIKVREAGFTVAELKDTRYLDGKQVGKTELHGE